METSRLVSTLFWLVSTLGGNQPGKGGNQPVGFHLVGFHLDTIDGPYGIFDLTVAASEGNLIKELKSNYKIFVFIYVFYYFLYNT